MWENKSTLHSRIREETWFYSYFSEYDAEILGPMSSARYSLLKFYPNPYSCAKNVGLLNKILERILMSIMPPQRGRSFLWYGNCFNILKGNALVSRC